MVSDEEFLSFRRYKTSEDEVVGMMKTKDSVKAAGSD